MASRAKWSVVALAALAVGAGVGGFLALRQEPAPDRMLTGGKQLRLPARTRPATSALPPRAPCGDEMLLVDGIWCPYVGHRCVDWIDEKRDRCRRYDEKELCEGLKKPKRFCIDRYEYPNQKDVYPAVMVSFIEAEEACRVEGKRLCTESEWTFACEGNEKVPYPYGYERDTTACNIDRTYILPDLQAFSYDDKIADEVGRLDQRVQSGSQPRCVSPFGVHDMTGNVDEWVVNEDPNTDGGEDISGLKGGYWGPIRARCRPVTNSHNRWFRFYQVGFRCCSEPEQG